jgi:LuxR family maltose regulon positive regulatory protein
VDSKLIQAKLYRPQASADLVQRPHLLDRLEEGLDHDLILVSAPPGAGKTTLASQWLADGRQTSAWLSLDEHDNDLPHFMRYVCAAVRHAFPQACETLQDLLASGYSSSSTNLPGTDALADLLVEELNALPDDLTLVLDDYHRIRAREVHHVLRQLLRYRPPRLHLVLLTRSDPPLSLGRLRLEQRITEIRGTDLRFGLEETRRLLQRHAGRLLGDEAIRSLQARTEGWAIGLQLAALSLQRGSPDQLLVRFGGNHRLLAGYLVEEVMDNLPEETATFLTRTALVDRFCAALGDALLAGSPWSGSSRAAIAQLEAQNLFVISLDDEDTWFRYHDLFRDFLLHRLQVEQGQAGLADLHRRAGAWLAEAGLIEDALRHLMAAGDEARAAELVETHLQPLLNQGVPWPVLARWLALFPETSIRSHAGLLIARAYLLASHWDWAAMAETLERTDAVMQAGSNAEDARARRTDHPVASLRRVLSDTLRGYFTYWQGDADRAIPLLLRALDHLDPAAHSFTYAITLQSLAQAYGNTGQLEKALDLLRTGLAEAIAHNRPERIIFMGARALIHLYAGELAEVARAAEEMLSPARAPATGAQVTGSVRIWRGWAYCWLGAVRYEQNDLAAAALHWRQVEGMRYQVNPGAYLDSLIGLALVARAQGEVVQALAYAQTAREYALEQRSPPFMRLAEALAVRLALAGGQHAEALRRAQGIDTSAGQGTVIWLERSCLTVVRALLAESSPTSLTAARQLAETCLRQAENVYNTRQVIQAAALQALVWRALQHTPEALAALDRALTLAEPRGFVRTFLDLGAPMAELLQQYERHSGEHGASPYVRRLLAAFARELDTAAHQELAAQYVQLYGITPLTPRELELLDLMARRLTYREIAERLVISPNTVKKHVSNIYGKLGVRNRRQAIARAQEVGLLSPV